MTYQLLALVTTWSGVVFLVVALVGGIANVVVEMAEKISANRAAAKHRRMMLASGEFAAPPPPIPPILDAVSGLVKALAEAPAWFAPYLAGLALLLLSASLVAETRSSSTSIVTKTTRTCPSSPNHPRNC